MNFRFLLFFPRIFRSHHTVLSPQTALISPCVWQRGLGADAERTSISWYMFGFTSSCETISIYHIILVYLWAPSLRLQKQQVQKSLVCWGYSKGWIVNTTILKHFPTQGGVIFQAVLWCLPAKHLLSCSEAFQTELLSMLACCAPNVSLD